MKKIASFLILLISAFAYPQHFTENYQESITSLTGIDDVNNQTNLLYTIGSFEEFKNGTKYYYNNIHKLNLSNGSDSVYLYDYIHDYPTDLYHNRVLGYTFRNKNVFDVVYAFDGFTWEPYYTIRNYSGQNIWYFGLATVKISNVFAYKNSSKFSFLFGENLKLMKFIQKDSAITLSESFPAVSHSPFNDSVYFAEVNGRLYKSVNEGFSKYPVDTTYAAKYSDGTNTSSFVYDKDLLHIYRVFQTYDGKYYLSVSASNGESQSWVVKHTSANKLYITANPNSPGELYVADGKKIYVSYDFGNTLQLVKELKSRTTGIFRSGINGRLYAATPFQILDISPSVVTVVKQIPFNKNVLDFDPVKVGNKWVYNCKRFQNGVLSSSFRWSKEVVKDTVINNMTYKKIRSRIFNPALPGVQNESFEFQRFDSTNGSVYVLRSFTGEEVIADSLNIVFGDSVRCSRYISSNTVTSLNTGGTFLFNNNKYQQRQYSTSGLVWSRYKYTLARGVGLVSLRQDDYDFYITTEISGFYVNDSLSGDTSLITSANDVNPSPDEYLLLQNYPNPFNPSTEITYTIANSGYITMKVYDVLGREIAVLINEVKSPGSYKVSFNAKDLPSGVYFYSLNVNDYTSVKKMILIR